MSKSLSAGTGRGLPQALEVEGRVVALRAQRAEDTERMAPPEGLPRGRPDHLGEEGVLLEEHARRGLHQPARLPAVPVEGGERRQGVHDVADRGEPDEESLQPRILARSFRVSWSFGSPTIATRPP